MFTGCEERDQGYLAKFLIFSKFQIGLTFKGLKCLIAKIHLMNIACSARICEIGDNYVQGNFNGFLLTAIIIAVYFHLTGLNQDGSGVGKFKAYK